MFISKVKEHFGKKTVVSASAGLHTIFVIPGDSSESDLTFENYKFLADLFRTTKISTDLLLGIDGGCPTCQGDSPAINEVTFKIYNAITNGE